LSQLASTRSSHLELVIKAGAVVLLHTLSPEQRCADGVGRVALVVVVFQHQAPLEGWCQQRVVLVRVVGVQRMRHVSTDEEGLAQCALNGPLLTLCGDTAAMQH